MLVIIGIIIGTVMGLTGAGGALVAIPLFMQLQGMSLKEASVYSLIAVVIASLSNFYHQRKEANIRLAILFVLFSALGSFFSTPFKHQIPDIGIAITLTVVALYSLYSVWIPSKKMPSENDQSLHLLKTIPLGLLLGVLTTFTGLGGGVLMLPLLIGIYHLPQTKAVATSLVVVGFSSLISFLIQSSKGTEISLGLDFLGLIAGTLLTSYLLKIIILKIPSSFTSALRKIIFTIVVILAIIKIF